MRASRPWTVWKARRVFHTLLATNPYDVIVMHSCWCHALLGGVARFNLNKIVLWGHSEFAGSSWEDRLTLGHPPNWSIANSRHTALSFAQALPNVPCQVVHLPLSAPAIPDSARARDTLREQLNIPSNTVAILQASRLEEWKGHRLLIHALSRLKRFGDRAKLIASSLQSAEKVCELFPYRA